MNQIERLKTEVEALTERLSKETAAINELTQLAATETLKDRLKKAREILERRELLKLDRVALSNTKDQLHAAEQEAERDLRIRNREQICTLVDEIEKDAKSMDAALRRAGKAYNRISDSARQVLALGSNAEQFDLTLFKTTGPTTAAYRYAVYAFAEAFNLEPKDHIDSWPRSHDRTDMKGRILSSFFNARDRWREPELLKLEQQDTEYREATEEEIANAIH